MAQIFSALLFLIMFIHQAHAETCGALLSGQLTSIPTAAQARTLVQAKSQTSSRTPLFLQKLRRDSQQHPSGVEVEIDLESIYENLVFSSIELANVAEDFCVSPLLQEYMGKAILEAVEDGLFSDEDLAQIQKHFRKWKSIAKQSKKGLVKEKVLELENLLKSSDDFASVVLKISLLKFSIQSYRSYYIIDFKKHLEESLNLALPEITRIGSELWFERNQKDFLEFVIESLLGQRQELLSTVLDKDSLIRFIRVVSHINALEKERNVPGVYFADPLQSGMVDQTIVSKPGELLFFASIEDRNPSIQKSSLTAGIELHAIASSAPSTTRRLVQKRIEEISDAPSFHTSLHMHVVAPVARSDSKIRPSALFPMLMRLEHGRRLEMLAHMVSLIVYDLPIEKRKEGFAPMRTSHVVDFFKGFPGYWSKDILANYIHKDRAFGYVSFTGPGNYKPLKADSVPKIFGYEFRFMPAEEDPESLGYIMDDAKSFLHGLVDKDLSKNLPPHFQKYFDRFLKERLEAVTRIKNPKSVLLKAFKDRAAHQAARVLFEAAYYLGSIEVDDDKGFYTAQQETNMFTFPGDLRPRRRSYWHRSSGFRGAEASYEVAFLYHNWNRDPLFFDKPILLRKIKAAQDKARGRLPGPDSTVSIVKEFLLESGIYDVYRNSIREID